MTFAKRCYCGAELDTGMRCTRSCGSFAPARSLAGAEDPRSATSPTPERCSFCGRHKRTRHRMVRASTGVVICAPCVEDCATLFANEHAAEDVRQGFRCDDARCECNRDEAHAVALQVLCRVFDDGADEAMEEWRAWYKPEQWLWHARGLGAFIHQRLLAKRSLTPDERSAVDELSEDMGHPIRDEAGTWVTISMRSANGLLSAIATPPRASLGNAPSETPPAARCSVCSTSRLELQPCGYPFCPKPAADRETPPAISENGSEPAQIVLAILRGEAVDLRSLEPSVRQEVESLLKRHGVPRATVDCTSHNPEIPA